MIDHAHVDFAAPKQPDDLEDYANGFQAGRQMMRPSGQPAQLPSAATDPVDGTASNGVDIQTHIAAMTEAQRQAAARTAETFAAILAGLRGATPDPRQRLTMAQHIAQRNPWMGIRPQDITLNDVDDQGIADHASSAMRLREMLAANAPSARPGGMDAREAIDSAVFRHGRNGSQARGAPRDDYEILGVE